MNYFMLGGDGKEYGPVGEQEIRKWVLEGRAVASTKVKSDRSSEWKPLSAAPEFQSLFHGSGSGNVKPPQITSEQLRVRAEEIRKRGIHVDIGSCLSRSWALYKENFGPLFGATFLCIVLSCVFQVIPIIGPLLSLAVVGPLYGGVLLFFLRFMRGERPALSAMFDGFTGPLWPLILTGLLTGVLTTIGFICLIVPGIYLAVSWILALPIVIDKRVDAWPAMEVSRRIVGARWWKVFGFSFVMLLVSFSGAILVGIGVFLTLPIGIGALAYLYEDLLGREG